MIPPLSGVWNNGNRRLRKHFRTYLYGIKGNLVRRNPASIGNSGRTTSHMLPLKPQLRSQLFRNYGIRCTSIKQECRSDRLSSMVKSHRHQNLPLGCYSYQCFYGCRFRYQYFSAIFQRDLLRVIDHVNDTISIGKAVEKSPDRIPDDVSGRGVSTSGVSVVHNWRWRHTLRWIDPLFQGSRCLAYLVKKVLCCIGREQPHSETCIPAKETTMHHSDGKPILLSLVFPFRSANRDKQNLLNYRIQGWQRS